MSAYTKSTNFATKDALISGDPLKVVKGTEIDTEFTNIQTAVASKADTLSPTFTGTVVAAAITIPDSGLTITGSSDATKKLKFEVDTNTPAATTLTVTPGQGQILPAGIGPLPYSGSSVPTGWLECDGSSKLRTDYPALFTAISTTWGSVDGTHFNLPDMRGRVAVCDGTGTVTEAVTDANVSVGGDTFTVGNNPTKWVTGQLVALTTTTTLPTGLALATPYYIVRASATTIQFASSLANAQNGTVINITAVFGSGTHTVTGTFTTRTLGHNGGEEAHAMSITELIAHTHTDNENTANNNANPGGGTAWFWNQSATVTGSRGGNVAANIMQPFIVTKYIISY